MQDTSKCNFNENAVSTVKSDDKPESSSGPILVPEHEKISIGRRSHTMPYSLPAYSQFKYD